MTFLDTPQDNINNVMSMYNAKVMVIGDMNADFASVHGQKLQSFAMLNNFTIHVTEPTRISAKSAKVLDQVLTNFPMYVKSIFILPPILSCDHNVVGVKCNFIVNACQCYKRTMWNFKETNFIDFKNHLRHYIWDCLSLCDIDEIAESFTRSLYNIAKTNIPNKEVLIRSNDKPWFTSKLRCMKRKCIRLFNALKKNRNPTYQNIYKDYHLLYCFEIKHAKKEYKENKLSDLAKHAVSKPQKWWKLLKDLTKENDTHESIPALTVDGEIVMSDKDKASAFNKFFLSVSRIDETNNILPDQERLIPGISLQSLSITNHDVLDQLLILDINKSYGPDEISPRFLKEIVHIFKNNSLKNFANYT